MRLALLALGGTLVLVAGCAGPAGPTGAAADIDALVPQGFVRAPAGPFADLESNPQNASGFTSSEFFANVTQVPVKVEVRTYNMTANPYASFAVLRFVYAHEQTRADWRRHLTEDHDGWERMMLCGGVNGVFGTISGTNATITFALPREGGSPYDPGYNATLVREAQVESYAASLATAEALAAPGGRPICTEDELDAAHAVLAGLRYDGGLRKAA